MTLSTKSEVWMDVAGFEKIYNVSNLGRVKSLPRVVPRGAFSLTIHGRIMATTLSRTGYCYLSLAKENTICRVFVHHLVLNAFVGPCPAGMQCCHNDGNPANNEVSNLRWDTPKNNSADKIKHGRMNWGERQGHAKLTNDKVRWIRMKLSEGIPQSVIAAKVGIVQSGISAIKRGVQWSHVI